MAASTIAANRIRTFIFSPSLGNTGSHRRHPARPQVLACTTEAKCDGDAAGRHIPWMGAGLPRAPRVGQVPAAREVIVDEKLHEHLSAPPPNGGLFGAGRHTHNSGVIVLDTQSRCAGSRTAPQMLTPPGAFLPIRVVSG